MKENQVVLSKIILIFSLILIGMSLIGIIFIFPMAGGDSYITLVFAKSFQKGFFYFGNEGPKWGATSPLLVLIFAPFYFFIRHPIWIFKVINLIFYVGTGYFIYKISKKLIPHYLIPISLAIWFNPYFSTLAITLYDTIIFCFLFSGLLFCFLSYLEQNHRSDKQLFFLFVTSGLLSLARPEGIVISLVFMGYLLIDKVIKNKRITLPKFIGGIIIFSLISLFYYLILAISTHQILPSSVKARILTAFYRQQEGFSITNLLKINSLTEAGLLLVLLASLFGVIFFIRDLEKRERFGYCFFILNLLFLGIYLTKDIRYTSLFLPLAAVFSVYFLNKLFLLFDLKKSLFCLLLICCLSLLIIPIAVYKYFNYYLKLPEYSENLIFELDATNFLNNICQPNDKVLAYEIQVQYYLKCQAISVDGVVGGEILPYLYSSKPEKITEFLLEYKPKYIIVSSAFNYRPEYKNSFLAKLYFEDKKIKANETISLDNIKFIKLINNKQEKVSGMNSWESIYEINYSI